MIPTTRETKAVNAGGGTSSELLFTSPAACTVLMASILVVCPSILFSIAALVNVLPPMPHLFVGIIHLYNLIHIAFGLTIFPSRYEVYSNRTLVVHTALPILPRKCIHFPGVQSAKPYRLNLFDTETRRWPFLTSSTGLVKLQRQSGWEVLISPQDPKGLLEAVESLESSDHNPKGV